MKLFSIYCVVKLEKKPEWFDDFRRKYDEDFELHITLKHPCFLELEDVKKVKDVFQKKVKILIQNSSRIELVFQKLNIKKESDGEYCVMIDAKENNELNVLQKKVRGLFIEYDNYIEKELVEYETDFHSHITIGRNIEENELTDVREIIGDNVVCKGFVKGVKLLIVDDGKKEYEEFVKNNNL